MYLHTYNSLFLFEKLKGSKIGLYSVHESVTTGPVPMPLDMHKVYLPKQKRLIDALSFRMDS